MMMMMMGGWGGAGWRRIKPCSGDSAGQSEDNVVGRGGGREQIAEESRDVRLPRLSHAGSPAIANMTSRAGASVSPPQATS